VTALGLGLALGLELVPGLGLVPGPGLVPVPHNRQGLGQLQQQLLIRELKAFSSFSPFFSLGSPSGVYQTRD